jgi:hypothetical protein
MRTRVIQGEIRASAPTAAIPTRAQGCGHGERPHQDRQGDHDSREVGAGRHDAQEDEDDRRRGPGVGHQVPQRHGEPFRLQGGEDDPHRGDGPRRARQQPVAGQFSLVCGRGHAVRGRSERSASAP